MKQFKTILNFEFKNYFKNKSFVGITLFMALLIAVVMFFPRISEQFKDTQTTALEDKAVMLILDNAFGGGETIKQTFETSFPDYNVLLTKKNISEIKSEIKSEEAECAFIITSPTSYTYLVNNLSMYDSNTAIADGLLTQIYRMNKIIEAGIPYETAADLLSADITHETENLGKDQTQNFFYTYIMIFALYMVILLYGQMVATNVATEKSSRAMELLITSAKPVSMMFGKVIASCLAGLIQLVAVFGSAYVFYNLNKSHWKDNMIISSIFDMPLSLLIYMLIFFVLGFFIYAFLYGAIGSTASKLEDINTSVMPLTMLFIVAFMVVMFSMAGGRVDNIAMLVCSYIPFTSPMAMFTRIAMSTVPIYEIIISIAILIASVIGVGIISAKIYRVGVLLYGTTPKLSSILKAIKKA
ncbi:MAG: ABC transporter permease [Clostridia bacterium]|nr:ABC transporter permease [Clostridia bacterium]